ncbi:NYN domain-containing protein [Pseudomonas atacamensis]|uniref:NYN domain-containing protein n=1 Tax=Pseudomonas atacamensis TaxID=2565368 RepID=UPI0019D01E66|nr:NYN domain-containing protein [Pseudomonas atacamensis]QSL85923.1 NYN domain-containing protein [Pseudomonas atacamensis]
MNRLGIFVDAGYLFAQGSMAITGNVVRRQDLSLNEQSVITQLIQAAEELSGGTPLLRIYWYDAIGHRGPTLDQRTLARSNNVKVRMGTLNGNGEQKGVDSMIVTDMIELARNHAIADAVLVSGDEDVRVGVQFAQAYGVRVHLIGISNAQGKANQSTSLIQEADTHIEWSPAVINAFLSVRQTVVEPEAVEIPPAGDNLPPAADVDLSPEEVAARMEQTVSAVVNALVLNDLTALKELLKSSNSVPREFDGKLLGKSRDAIGRDLTQAEKGLARSRFRELVIQK